jgi:hypothetical protein
LPLVLLLHHHRDAYPSLPFDIVQSLKLTVAGVVASPLAFRKGLPGF